MTTVLRGWRAMPAGVLSFKTFQWMIAYFISENVIVPAVFLTFSVAHPSVHLLSISIAALELIRFT